MNGAQEGGATGDRRASRLSAEELERGTERLAGLVLSAHALAERKRAAGALTGLSPAAQECIRRLDAGAEAARRALGAALDNALGEPDRAQEHRLDMVQGSVDPSGKRKG